MNDSYSRFWKLTAALPLAATAVSASGQAAPVQLAGLGQHQAGRWTFHHEHVLGTSLEISLMAANQADADRAESAILTAFDHDEALLSTWRADSEVSHWASTRFEPVAVSSELFEILAAFDSWRERTAGALDASVEAATHLWNTATSEGRLPTRQEIAVAIEAMQQPHWSLDRDHQTATRLSDVPLALASFTKSYISSRAADAALNSGATGVMLNVGGDIIVRGNYTQMVAIANPEASAENDLALDHVVVRDRAVATSGSYRRGFDVAQAVQSKVPQFSHIPQFSHLIDPRTAEPASHILSSTVIAKDATTAGALATAFSVLSVDDSRKLAATVPGLQYLLVLPSGEQVRSANWPSQTAALRLAAYSPSSRTGAPTAGLWDPSFELSLDLTLPRIEDARYRRPYVAVWVEDADHFPVRTIALWTEKPRYINELREWYREDRVRNLSEGTDISRTVSSATRPPGSYTVKWDGKDNAGKLVKAGTYTICVEVTREHGGYNIQRHELTVSSKPQQTTIPAAGRELGAVTIDYRKR